MSSTLCRHVSCFLSAGAVTVPLPDLQRFWRFGASEQCGPVRTLAEDAAGDPGSCRHGRHRADVLPGPGNEVGEGLRTSGTADVTGHLPWSSGMSRPACRGNCVQPAGCTQCERMRWGICGSKTPHGIATLQFKQAVAEALKHCTLKFFSAARTSMDWRSRSCHAGRPSALHLCHSVEVSLRSQAPIQALPEPVQPVQPVERSLPSSALR